MQNDDQRVLITASASPIRRSIAVLVMGFLGFLLLSVALNSAMPILWQGFYVALGLFSFWGAWRLWQATSDSLELTRTEFRTTSGWVLATVADVARVDRGAFAFKPSNGFVVHLKDPAAARGWAPGLWWRFGTRIGVGGVVSAGEARAMAEVFTAVITGVYPDDADL